MGKGKKKVQKVDWVALVDEIWANETNSPSGDSQLSDLAGNESSAVSMDSTEFENTPSSQSMVIPPDRKERGDGDITNSDECTLSEPSILTSDGEEGDTTRSEDKLYDISKGNLMSEDPLATKRELPQLKLKQNDSEAGPEGSSLKLSFHSNISYTDMKTHSFCESEGGSFTPVNSISKVSANKPRKLFPLFVNRKISTALKMDLPLKKENRKRAADTSSPLDMKRPKLALSKNSKKENLEQLHLDLGQKTFGHVTCKVCGMIYTYGQPEDQLEHIRFHKKFVSGIKFTGWKNERVILEHHSGRIILVLPTDPKHHLRKVEEVCRVVDSDLGYVTGATVCSNRSKIFLCISNQKCIMGCIVAEKISEGYRVLTSENTGSRESEDGLDFSAWFCSTDPEPAMLGINRMWVSSQCRRQGVATRLLSAVRSTFIAGYIVPKDQIAFSDPTPDGRAFASKYCGTPNFLVYKWT